MLPSRAEYEHFPRIALGLLRRQLAKLQRLMVFTSTSLSPRIHPIEMRGLFDHAVAQARYGASIFWVRPGLLLSESIEDFVAYWQVKRDGSKRGIVEVNP